MPTPESQRSSRPTGLVGVVYWAIIVLTVAAIAFVIYVLGSS
jgi:hypothetical protein